MNELDKLKKLLDELLIGNELICKKHWHWIQSRYLSMTVRMACMFTVGALVVSGRTVQNFWQKHLTGSFGKKWGGSYGETSFRPDRSTVRHAGGC